MIEPGPRVAPPNGSATVADLTKARLALRTAYQPSCWPLAVVSPTTALPPPSPAPAKVVPAVPVPVFDVAGRWIRPRLPSSAAGRIVDSTNTTIEPSGASCGSLAP